MYLLEDGYPPQGYAGTGLVARKLAGMTEPVMEPGYPEPESFAVRRCLKTILNEEWEHRLYAERDFDVLESRR